MKLSSSATAISADAAIAAAKADTRNTWIDLTPEEIAGFSQALAPITDAYVKQVGGDEVLARMQGK